MGTDTGTGTGTGNGNDYYGYGYGYGYGTTAAAVPPPVCSGLSWVSPDSGVAAGLSGADVVLVTESGARRVVYSFDVPSGQTVVTGSPRLVVSHGLITTSVAWPEPSGATRSQSVTVDAMGQILPGRTAAVDARVPSASRTEPAVVVPPVARRRLEGEYCDRIDLFENGEVGVGFRDDQDAAWFVGPPNGTFWKQIGDSVRDVIGMNGYRVADTWVITGNSGRNSYCPLFEPFTGSQNEGVLLGDTVQILAPGAEPLVLSGNSPWSIGGIAIDPTGLCVYHEAPDGSGDARVYDLGEGTSTDMSGLRQFTWIR